MSKNASDTTNYPNGVTSWGAPVSGMPVILGASGSGTIWFVSADRGSDGNSGLTMDSAFLTIEKAYDMASSGDTIALSTNATHNLTTGLAITKSRINFVGLDFPGRLIQQGAKVQVTGNVDIAYVIKDTGTRNSFTNIKFIQSSTNANALNVFQGGGEGTLFNNCSFVFGVVDNLDLTTSSEFLAGTDSATFSNCVFGADTLLTSGARTVFKVDIVNTAEFKSNILENCKFFISSSEAGANFVGVAATGDILFSNLFNNCQMVASIDSAGGVALTRAVISPNGMSKGTLYFSNCAAFGVTNFGTNGTNNDNIQTYGPASTGTDLVGLAPTAT